MKRLTLMVISLTFTLAFGLSAAAQTFNAVQTDSGLVVSATSTYSTRFNAEYAVNGDTTGTAALDGTGQPGTDRPTRGFWNNGNSERHGTSSLTLAFGRPTGYSLRRIEVVGVRSDFQSEREPTTAEESPYALTDFSILISRNGVDFALACNFVGNKKVIVGCDIDPWNTVRFIRVTVTKSADGFHRIGEVKAPAKEF